MNFGRALAASAVACLLAACAVLPAGGRIPPAAPFDILGRVLVSQDGRAFSSNFRWRHDETGEEIWLMSPGGQTLAHIIADGDGATLTAADQQTYFATSVEGLTRRVLGWSLPLARLQHWVGGHAVPGTASAASHDAAGRLTLLEQDGWRIRYTPNDMDPEKRPQRLDLGQGTQQIRMVIDERRVDVR